jgi:uncharacterized protein (DUF305 family)
MRRYRPKIKFSGFRHQPGSQLTKALPFLVGFLVTMSPLQAMVGARSSASFVPGKVQARQTPQLKTEVPVIVQPGAPGTPSRKLPPTTRATLPPASQADVEFMKEMIMHHAQAVEMTALIPSHTKNPELASLGARISRSQSDEIKFMKRWLDARGESTAMPMPGMPEMDIPQAEVMLMPGMLTPQQMEALRNATGNDFDRLFLSGMIQHHNGALTMVKELFNTAGAGQDADIFTFATDADNTQRAEIKIMQNMLRNGDSEEKQ